MVQVATQHAQSIMPLPAEGRDSAHWRMGKLNVNAKMDSWVPAANTSVQAALR